MRRVVWGLLLLFAFAVPWEYSLDLGEPLGNIARVVGLMLLLTAIPAVATISLRRAGSAEAMLPKPTNTGGGPSARKCSRSPGGCQSGGRGGHQ